MTVNVIDCLINKTAKSVCTTDDTMTFGLITGEKIIFYHSQDCCETVYIEAIDGHIDDLVGSPLFMAEEILEYDGHTTYTFYKFATIKGYVTVRWNGRSSSYYSETVDIKIEGETEVNNQGPNAKHLIDRILELFNNYDTCETTYSTTPGSIGNREVILSYIDEASNITGRLIIDVDACVAHCSWMHFNDYIPSVPVNDKRIWKTGRLTEDEMKSCLQVFELLREE